MHKHKKGALLLLIFLIVLFIFLGRDDETSEDTSLPVENTTDIIIEKTADGQADDRFKVKKTKGDLPEEVPSLKVSRSQQVTLTLTDTKDINHTVTLIDQSVMFPTSEKPIVLVNIFSTWCIPCLGQVPYLNDLQKQHQKELFVAGILTHDTIEAPALNRFIAKHQINYFVSNSANNDTFSTLLASTLDLPENFSIPLTVMYVKGEYFTHYEGTVPVEMIEYDIQQAKKQLNAR
ncbi:MAG TPA: TlpA disulfide reductase family protein [Sulfurovum sp.]|uniref:TlpA disulfide reductase family protein n=1 Tax=Sulfurovum sp. TaxID=1969726 RepID=UPI002F93A435